MCRLGCRANGWCAACIEILAVLAAAVAMLFRVAHIPAWDLVYAEDNGVFLVGALAHPWHLLTPFGGYLELVPRILGQIVSLLPLWDAARIYAAFRGPHRGRLRAVHVPRQ